MDVSSVRETSQTGRSPSPIQPALEQNQEFDPKGLCSEPVEQKHESAENVQEGSAEARAAESDSISVEQMRLPEDSPKTLSRALLTPPPEDATISGLEQMELPAEIVTRKISNAKQTTSGLIHEFSSESVNIEPLEKKQVTGTENDGSLEIRKAESDHIGLEQVGLPPEEMAINSCWEQLRPPLEELTMKSLEQLGLPPKDVATNSLEQLGQPTDDKFKNPGLEQLGPTQEDAAKNPSQFGHRENGTSVRPSKGENLLRSLVGSTRVLRSRSQEKSKVPEPSNNLAEDGANREKKRKKKKQIRKFPVNEFARIKRHLRYLLTRMQYEQNLIDAYSGEGWKGLSLEKLKPEKELRRAKSEIFRCKLKIRDLFQRLDMSCAEGRLPESLFDSKGEIDSEDIFCAKCGAKDLVANNDIILCDGACQRGFHQFCLEPPLLNEDIPPDDEGWLCPGCDCKVDCCNLLNDSQGMKLAIIDSWEKVFPEAAAAAAGNKVYDNFGFPSDDSEDDDYDPDGLKLNEKVHGDESSSEESDFSSASDDLCGLPNDEQYLGLPSDDSEDDDYNPNALDLDEQVEQESSSSDFTSDSEDFSVAFDDNSPVGEVQGPMYLINSNSEKSKMGGTKRKSLGDELLALWELDPGDGDSVPVSGKRHVERLDYKKLHDETYGNVSSDSSDEDFMDTTAPKKRKNYTGTNAKDMRHNQNESNRTPKRRTSKKLDVENTSNSSAKSHKGSSEPCSSRKRTTSSAYKRLGEAVTQRLFESFKENQYPERGAKENLAKELALTLQQVSKWFENARWSFRHSSRMESSIAASPSNKSTSQINKKLPEHEVKMVTEDADCKGVEKKGVPDANPGAMECWVGDVRAGNLVMEEDEGKNPRTSKSRKRKVN